MNKSQKKISSSLYLEPCQSDGLKKIQKHTGIPQAEIIRQGVDTMLDKFGLKDFTREDWKKWSL